MAAVNVRRVFWGGLAGGVAWIAWATIVNFVLLMPRYVVTQQAGLMYEKSRYAIFPLVWMGQFLAFGVLIAALYAGVRATWGAGPLTAIKVGLIFGVKAIKARMSRSRSTPGAISINSRPPSIRRKTQRSVMYSAGCLLLKAWLPL